MRNYVFKSPFKRLLVGFFDLFGYIFTIIPMVPEEIVKNPKKMLILRTDHLGDVVMSLPAIKSLRERFPHAHIDLLVDETIYPLFEKIDHPLTHIIKLKNGWFKRGVTFRESWKGFWDILNKIKINQYDVFIDFRGDLRHNLLGAFAHIPCRIGRGITGGGFLLHHEDNQTNDHQVRINQQLLTVFGIENRGIAIEELIHPTEESQKLTQALAQFESLPANCPKIVIHPSAGLPEKEWGSQNYITLIKELQQKIKGHIVMIGTVNEKAKMDCPSGVIDLRGELSLADLPALLSQADIFIGNDSGPAHIAGMQAINTFVLFGGINDSNLWKPRGPKVTLIDSDDIRAITVEDVSTKVYDRLKRNSA